MLLSHREELDLIAHALLEYETLDASHIKDLMDDGEMSDPPPSPMPPEIDTENKKLKIAKILHMEMILVPVNYLLAGA